MKLIKTFSISILFLSVLPTMTCFAHDTDLYMASGEGVEPNILIIFDNSGSMNDPAPDYVYDSAKTYPHLVADTEKVYYKSGNSWNNVFKNSIAEVPCSTARNWLSQRGHYEGPTNSSCSKNSRTLRTGNYRNFLASVGESNENLAKLTIAKRVISEFLDTVTGVRIGVMIFNYSEGGRIQSVVKSLNDTTRPQLKTDINNITASTWTPLAETLYEAGLYFKGGPSQFNSGVVYTSPIQYQCQRNYVIIITDGESTKDRNTILSTAIGDRDNDGREPGGRNEVHYADDGSDYLDDVAKYLYDTDLRLDLTNQQNIITYTIGFTIHSDLLERTATLGHGRYFYCNNALSLADVFQNIIDDILAKSTSFVAPIVPVSRMERTTAGDKIYLALFKPVKDGMWSGNIKKFGLAQQDNPSLGIQKGDIVDANGLKALDSNGQFFSTAKSFWTSTNMDGGDVEKGGVGEVLLGRTSSRNICTYLGSDVNLTNSSNAFTLANTSITPTLLGLLSDDNVGRDKLIQFVHGYDAYDDNDNGDTAEKRDWILGAFLHSRPLIFNYPTRSVIFAGSNDGMLHAFNDEDGTELWAFIPPDLLNKLQALHADVLQSFVDGSPKVYISYSDNGSINQVVLIFGERRGGNHYYALDVTDPLNPKYLWNISPDVKDGQGNSPYSELGQTWSTPNIAKIAFGEGEKWVVFVGGGYDDNQDNDPTTTPDSKGRGIYVVDVMTGSLLWRYSYAENSGMTYSIPSDIARVDTDGDGKIDRLYVGDTGGRMWRFDIRGSNPASWTGKIIFQSNSGPGDGRKIFYPPDVALEKDSENYEMLFFGTGDREHPKESTIINRLYAVKDKNSGSVLTENNLVDVTQDLLQDPGASQAEKNTLTAQLGTMNGWYIKLDTGEKSLAIPVVFSKTVYFTTFAPTLEGGSGDPCYVGEGIARLYALDYLNGNAAFNFDLTNDVNGRPTLGRSDRSIVVGAAIPSGTIVTVIGGTMAAGYIGVGGGIYKAPLKRSQVLVPIYWKQIF